MVAIKNILFKTIGIVGILVLAFFFFLLITAWF